MKTAATAGGALLASPFLPSAAKAEATPGQAVAGSTINYGTRAHFGMLLPSVNTAAEVQVTAIAAECFFPHHTAQAGRQQSKRVSENGVSQNSFC